MKKILLRHLIALLYFFMIGLGIMLLFGGLVGNVASSSTDWVVGSDGDAWVGNVSFDNTTVDYENAELLNGYNPRLSMWITSGGTWGNTVLNAQEKKQSQRFTAHFNKTLTHIGIYQYIGGAAAANYNIGIQGDNGGFPDGNWIVKGTYKPDTGANWIFVKMDNSVKLTKGTIYHIVIAWHDGSIGAEPEIYGIWPTSDSIPFNLYGTDTNIDIIDSNAYVSLYTNADGWVKSDGEMTFLLDFNDNTYYGNPWTHGYASLADKSAWQYREVLKISLQNKTVRTIGTALGARATDWVGGDTDANWDLLTDIQYEISDGTTVLRNGIIATRDQIKSQYRNYTYYNGDRRFAWYEVNLSSPLTMVVNQTYYITFFAPGTNPTLNWNLPLYIADCFHARNYWHATLLYDGPNPLDLTSWDGTNSYFERYSSDSGSIWKNDEKTRDISLKMKLVDVYNGNITSITKDAESVGTFGDVWKQIKFEGLVLSGTNVSIAVNSTTCSDFVIVQENAVSGVTYDLPSCAQERYANWRLALHTDNPSLTPEIYNVTLIAAPNESLSPIDINQDGTIDISDLRLVALHFGETTTSPYPRYDVDANGTVDILDIRQVAGGM